MQHRFRTGDRVVIVGGWFCEEYGKAVSGTFDEEDVSVVLDEPTKCHWKYRIVRVSYSDLISEELYNSPLYQALE